MAAAWQREGPSYVMLSLTRAAFIPPLLSLQALAGLAVLPVALTYNLLT